MTEKAKAVFYAIAAAVFYALNVPCSKLLLERIAPTYMAAFLYLGAGAGVGIMYLFHHKHEASAERLEKRDMPYTVGMVLLDIIAPILLMLGVKLGTSANASLLGNFEIVATTLIALFIFKEKISRKLWAAIGLITLSSIILSFGGEGSFTFSVGSLLVLGATACWGLENNCTRRISDKSTYQIVTIKGFGSAAGSLIVAVIIGEKLPDIKYILPAAVLGFVAYGLSIFTYIRAQKTLGAAKTSAYYAFAPFIGAFLSFILLHESLTIVYLIALAVMIAGTAFVVSDTLKQK
ncbi:MAG: DMT family transporter [Ruminococcus sp.]|nr:DMT family transporter [Ruminococcus sp.]